MPEIGGTERMVLSLVKGMNKDIFENDVCFLYPKGALSDAFEKECRVYYLDYGKVSLFGVISRLYKILKSNNYDIVHIYGLKANIIGRLVGFLARCKRIVSGLRGKYPGDKESKLYLFLDKLTLPFIRLYVSNSKSAVDFLVKNGYPKEIFRVVYNGIDENALLLLKDSSLKESLNIKDESILVCVSNLKSMKGHDMLIKSAKILKDKGISFKLLLVGDGPLKEKLIHMVTNLSLGARVIFLGQRNDIGNLLSLSHIFVFPSKWEGMPVSVMEAYLAKLPVVAFDTSGVCEIVLDGETGLLAEPFNVEEFTSSIEILIKDSEKRKRMGEAGYRRIKERFSLTAMIEGVEEIYLELMKE